MVQNYSRGNIMNPNFISVVVPTYNRKEMLKECLESLFNQSYPSDKYEIIVIDSSDDITNDMIQRYKEKSPCKLKYFIHDPKGPAAARNFGVENAEGEIICFIDDDCIAHKDWIKNMASSFINKEIGGIAGKLIPYKPQTLIEEYAEKNIQLDYRILTYIATCNAVYRKNILLAVGGFDTNLRTHEDRDLSIRVRLKGYKLKYNQRAIVYYRYRSTLKDLIKQQYLGAVGFMSLNKKYPRHFRPRYYIPLYFIKTIYTVILGAIKFFKAFTVKNKVYHITEQFLDIILLIADLAGMIRGAFFGKKYVGEKIYEEIEFIPEKSILKVVWSKIREIL